MEKKNFILQTLNSEELAGINGGGEWKWEEALICFAIGGLIGVGFYTLGTKQ